MMKAMKLFLILAVTLLLFTHWSTKQNISVNPCELKVGNYTFVKILNSPSVTPPKATKAPKAVKCTGNTGNKRTYVANSGNSAKGGIRYLKGGNSTSVKISKSPSVTTPKSPKSFKEIKGTSTSVTKAPSVAKSKRVPR